MALVPEIVFDNMDPSAAVAARVTEKSAKLVKRFDRLTHVRVVVEAPHRHHHKGKIYHCKITLGLPGRADLVVNHGNEDDHAHEDVYVAVRDAFEAARRQLEDATERMRGEIKAHRE